MNPALGLIKLSIIFFYRRVFMVSKDTKFARISAALAIFILCWTIVFLLVLIFGCGKYVSLHWDPLGSFSTQCGNQLAAEVAFVVSDLATDLMILVLPLPMVRSVPQRSAQLSNVGQTDLETKHDYLSKVCSVMRISRRSYVSCCAMHPQRLQEV